jgi:GT2 family glycosyltransferase
VKSAIAILTYRRLYAIMAMMDGVGKHCPTYKTAIFEDCGQRDGTADWLTKGRKPVNTTTNLMATEWGPIQDETGVNYGINHPNARVFLGDRNLGVTGNSNRALKWFMDGDCDHLCLCNDDLLVTGDFVKYYAQGHQDLGVGMFCFCDFTKASPAISGRPETYKWTTYRWRGYGVKFLPRFTGIMMSVTRALVEKIGYFDAEFGKFGEEHCDYTIRARMAGGIQCEGQDMNCLDLEHTFLEHQDVETSMTGPARTTADQEAGHAMQRASFEYRMRHFHRPYRLTYPISAGGYYGAGIPCRQLEQIGYKLVTDLV